MRHHLCHRCHNPLAPTHVDQPFGNDGYAFVSQNLRLLPSAEATRADIVLLLLLQWPERTPFGMTLWYCKTVGRRGSHYNAGMSCLAEFERGDFSRRVLDALCV